MKRRMICPIDCASFFVSCELLDNPALRRLPAFRDNSLSRAPNELVFHKFETLTIIHHNQTPPQGRGLVMVGMTRLELVTSTMST